MLGGRAHRDTELGTDEALADRPRRSRCGRTGEHIGALVLVRDVTDLRRRDRELVTKDATIREIHHRVKNNLQTVAALLRLQARRMDSADGQGRARGGGTPGRLDRDRARDAEPGGRGERRLRRGRRPARRDGRPRSARSATGCGSRRDGLVRRAAARRPRPRWRWCSPSCSRTPSSTATPADGSAAGTIVVAPRELVGRLHVTVDDDGRGLPDGFDLDASTQPRALDRAARWWSPSSAVSSSSGPAPGGLAGTRVRDRRTAAE